MSEPIVVGYRHTGIITRDINKSLYFYKNILGLQLIQDFTDSSDYINEITGLKGAIAHFIKLKCLDIFLRLTPSNEIFPSLGS